MLYERPHAIQIFLLSVDDIKRKRRHGRKGRTANTRSFAGHGRLLRSILDMERGLQKVAPTLIRLIRTS